MKFRLIILLLFLTNLIYSQTGTINATVTDGAGQTINNGTYSIIFHPTPGIPGVFSVNGSPFTLSYSGSLDSGGSFSQGSITRNDFIQPAGSTWDITICPNASVNTCTTINFNLINASLSLTSQLSTAIGTIQFPAIPTFNRGYSSSEVVPTPNPGAGFWDVSASCLKIWSGSSWSCVGGSTGVLKNVADFSGVDIGTKINNCLISLPSTGGICDARSLTGTFSNSTNPVAGLTSKPYTLLLGYITINDSSTWLFSNDGNSLPAQGSRKIIGIGYDAASIPAGKVPVSGTIINNSSVTGVAKFDTRGAGYLEVSGITFQDSSGDSLPFWQTTNTIINFHDNQCYGSKNGVLNDQDCLVLGGTTTNIDGSSTAAFQGYGTQIYKNFFNHIRRAIYGRTYFNGVPITDNTVWEQAGTNLAGGAAFELVDSSGSNSNAGNDFRGNLIEVINYPYAIKLSANGVNNSFSANNFYDGNSGVSFIAGIRFESNSKFNIIHQGFQSDVYPGISEDAGSLNTNTFFTSHQNQVTTLPQIYNYTGIIRYTTPSVNQAMYNMKISTTNDEFWWGISTSGQPSLGLWLNPAGGTPENLFTFRRYDINQRGLMCSAATTCFLEAIADLRLRAASGSTLWLGTNANPSAILINDSSSKYNGTIDNSGSAWKHVHSALGCSTAAAIGATCTTGSISWNGTAFSSVNYDLTCTLSGTLTNVPIIVGTTKSTGSFTVTIAALTAAAATAAEVDCDAKQ